MVYSLDWDGHTKSSPGEMSSTSCYNLINLRGKEQLFIVLLRRGKKLPWNQMQ